MATLRERNVTQSAVTQVDGFEFIGVPNIDLNQNFDVNFRKCMLALRVLLNVPKFFPVLGGHQGLRVVLNTVFKINSEDTDDMLVNNLNVSTVQQKTYPLFTLVTSNNSLLCQVYTCSQLLYAEVLYMINSVLYNGKLNTLKLELSIEDQSTFLYMFSATVIYLAHVLYSTLLYTKDCSEEDNEIVENLYEFYKEKIGNDTVDIVRKLYLLLFYKFQLLMNEKQVFISDYIE